MKTCTKCNNDKDLICFYNSKASSDGKRSVCKECDNSRKKLYYDKNRTDILEKAENYRATNKTKISAINKKYNAKNKTKINAKNKLRAKKKTKYYINYVKKRKTIDKLFSFKLTIKKLIHSSFYRKNITKAVASRKILGCTFEYFKQYLEDRFESWMTWENRGLYNGEPNYGWDIDHIIPLSSAKTHEETIMLNHHTNLQPLCSYINRNVKRDSIATAPVHVSFSDQDVI